MTRYHFLTLALLLGACAEGDGAPPDQEPRPASALSAAEIGAACAELQDFFRRLAESRTAAIRPGGALPWREHVHTMYLDSSAFFFNGNARKPVRYSTEALATPTTAEDTLPDPRYEWRNITVAVGIASEREALYVMRFADLYSDYFTSAGREDPYISIQGGKLVRTGDGWRILQVLDMSDRTGLGESALVAEHTAWECR